MYVWKSIKTQIVSVIGAISNLTSGIARIGHVVLLDVNVAAIATGIVVAKNCVTMISVFD